MDVPDVIDPKLQKRQIIIYFALIFLVNGVFIPLEYIADSFFLMDHDII